MKKKSVLINFERSEKSRFLRSEVLILGTLFGFNILAWIGVYSLSQQFLEVTFFDVGQGDSIFIETQQLHQILIDGGPGSTVSEKLSEEMPFWDRTIDLVILTHPERDHMTGLLDVLKRYKVENILWTGIVRDTAEFEKWQELIDKEKANIVIAESSLNIGFGKSGYIDILSPSESLEGKEFKDSNDTSVVARLVFGENSFLFTGDITKSVELSLLGLDIDSDVLKVAHHGSKTSSTPEFIGKVSPEIAVIQVGKDNSYGHPHSETLETLKKYGIDILRTDTEGDIKLVSDRNKIYAISNLQN
jgi:competence protein ComEC